MTSRPALLYVTDLAYEAKGRRYCDEDIFLSEQLRQSFTVALTSPVDATEHLDRFDAVVVRNSGPVSRYEAAHRRFRDEATRRGTRVYNPLHGRGDTAGKQYLVELTALDFPVIPTVDRLDDLARLPDAVEYVVKPKAGADSIGMAVVPASSLSDTDLTDMLVQPRVDFVHEVSFVFVDHDFAYAVVAPDRDRRWDLEVFVPSTSDLAFARRFVEWNSLDHGIQRVDACRTRDGGLLLVELEDLNPYLSLDRLSPTRQREVASQISRSISRFLRL